MTVDECSLSNRASASTESTLPCAIVHPNPFHTSLLSMPTPRADVRTGHSENAWVNVTPLITYHRYLRFMPNGTYSGPSRNKPPSSRPCPPAMIHPSGGRPVVLFTLACSSTSVFGRWKATETQKSSPYLRIHQLDRPMPRGHLDEWHGMQTFEEFGIDRLWRYDGHHSLCDGPMMSTFI